MKTTKKYLLKNRVVEKLKNTRKYFSYEDIKVLLEEERIEIPPQLLKVYIFELVKTRVLFGAGKGWYSSIENAFQLNLKPVEQVIKKLEKKLPLLKFSCWSTEQLNSFTHHLMSKFVTFIYVDSDYIRNTAQVLRDAGYDIYANPVKKEIEKQFVLNRETLIVRPSISRQPGINKNYAPVEKILADFLIENEKVKIMEKSEAYGTVYNVIVSGRINISMFLSYSKRRRLDVFDLLTNSK